MGQVQNEDFSKSALEYFPKMRISKNRHFSHIYSLTYL